MGCVSDKGLFVAVFPVDAACCSVGRISLPIIIKIEGDREKFSIRVVPWPRLQGMEISGTSLKPLCCLARCTNTLSTDGAVPSNGSAEM